MLFVEGDGVVTILVLYVFLLDNYTRSSIGAARAGRADAVGGSRATSSRTRFAVCGVNDSRFSNLLRGGSFTSVTGISSGTFGCPRSNGHCIACNALTIRVASRCINLFGNRALRGRLTRGNIGRGIQRFITFRTPCIPLSV